MTALPAPLRLGARVDRWLRLVAALYLAVCVLLFACTVVPLAVGWRSNLVVSGSMAPAMPTGSVLITSPAREREVHPGTVVLVREPAVPGGTLAHRVVRRDAKGRLILRGDAAPTEDARPVPASDVLGVARLAVPAVGLPAIWVRERSALPLLLWLATTSAAAAVLVRRRSAG